MLVSVLVLGVLCFFFRLAMMLLQKKTAVVSDWLVLSPCVRSSSGAGVTLKLLSADTQHSDSACKAPDTEEEHGLLHRIDKYFLQTHIFKPTLPLRASKAGGWQAMGNGRTEQGASILITVKKRKKKDTLQMLFKKRFFHIPL